MSNPTRTESLRNGDATSKASWRNDESERNGELDSECLIDEENALGAGLLNMLHCRHDGDMPVASTPDSSAMRNKTTVLNTSGIEDGEGQSDRSTGTRPKRRPVSDESQESDVEKMKKWKEAGVALRKALNDQPGDSVARTPSSLSSSFHGSSDDPMNLMLDDYLSASVASNAGNVGASRQPDQKCDTLRDCAKNDVETAAADAALPKAASGHRKHLKQQHKQRRNCDDVSESLASVREKIREITSRISMNQTSASRGQTSKSSRGAARSQRRSSKTEESGSSSSDFSADEVVPKRHKFVHKTQRTRSSSRSPKTNITPPGSFRDKALPCRQDSEDAARCQLCGGIPKCKQIPGCTKRAKLKLQLDGRSHLARQDQTDDFQNGANSAKENRKDCLQNALDCKDDVSEDSVPELVTESENELSDEGLQNVLNSLRKHTPSDGQDEKLPELFSSSEEENELGAKLCSLVSKVSSVCEKNFLCFVESDQTTNSGGDSGRLGSGCGGNLHGFLFQLSGCGNATDTGMISL